MNDTRLTRIVDAPAPPWLNALGMSLVSLLEGVLMYNVLPTVALAISAVALMVAGLLLVKKLLPLRIRLGVLALALGLSVGTVLGYSNQQPWETKLAERLKEQEHEQARMAEEEKVLRVAAEKRATERHQARLDSIPGLIREMRARIDAGQWEQAVGFYYRIVLIKRDQPGLIADWNKIATELKKIYARREAKDRRKLEQARTTRRLPTPSTPSTLSPSEALGWGAYLLCQLEVETRVGSRGAGVHRSAPKMLVPKDGGYVIQSHMDWDGRRFHYACQVFANSSVYVEIYE